MTVNNTCGARSSRYDNVDPKRPDPSAANVLSLHDRSQNVFNFHGAPVAGSFALGGTGYDGLYGDVGVLPGGCVRDPAEGARNPAAGGRPSDALQLEPTQSVHKGLPNLIGDIPILGDLFRGFYGVLGGNADLDSRHAAATTRIKNAYDEGRIDQTQAESLAAEVRDAAPSAIDQIPVLSLLSLFGGSNSKLRNVEQQLDNLGVPQTYGPAPRTQWGVI